MSHRPQHPTSLAIHLSRYVRRMPGMPDDRALRFGVSYTRALLERHGSFREDMLGGEDADFNNRIAPTRIHWAPEVVTAHHGLEHLLPALVDQYRRGRQRIRSLAQMGNFERRGPLASFLSRVRFARKFAPYVVEPELRPVFVRGLPVFLLCIAAYCHGEWVEGRR